MHPMNSMNPRPIDNPAEDEKELKRQETFLALASHQVEELTLLLGRTPTFCVVNFGCQMNARDAEKLSGILISAGYKEGQDESADFVIYNTCTVRDNADNHFFGRLGRAAHWKKDNPFMRIAVCGCMMQEEKNIEKIKKSYPYVDLIFGTHNIFRFPEYLTKVNEPLLEGKHRHRLFVNVWKETDRIVEDLPVERKYPFKSGVNIMFGCNNFCSYCIVPYVRGRERSRKAKDIVREIESLVKDGVVEVMLLGQNVNSYGNDLRALNDPDAMTFAELLDEVASIPGLKRVRFMTPHPKDFTDDVLKVMQKHKNIARHVHLPLQSGSTRILKVMNRRYTREQYLSLAEKIRTALPDAAITTDIIAGFPGEEASDIDETIDVINKVQYDNAYTFIYSPRTGTPAAAMKQVPKDTVQQGFDRILAAVQESAKKRAGLLQGKVLCGLCEEIDEQKAGYVTCRLSSNMIVHVPGDASMIGRFYDVSLDTCMGFYYFGHVVRENETGLDE